MSTPQAIVSELQKLAPSAIIELFVVDASNVGAGILYFHAGTNQLLGDIVWQGQTYIKFPVEATGFEINGQGQIPRPRLRVSNYLSALTPYLLQYGDLIGAKVIRKRTLKKYLDSVNFVGGNPYQDLTAHFEDDVYFIDRKASESRDLVEFELASVMDLAGVQLPRRQIVQNVCVWKYRGAECGYTDTRYFKADDTQTVDSSQDACGKRLSSCKARFGSGGELPFGSFPAAGLVR